MSDLEFTGENIAKLPKTPWWKTAIHHAICIYICFKVTWEQAQNGEKGNLNLSSKLLKNSAISENAQLLPVAHLCILNPTDFQLEIIYIVNDYRAKHQPLTKLTKQYSLLLLKTGYASNASCVTMLGLHASCSIAKDMNLQGSLTRAGHRAAKSTNSTEVSLMPTICWEEVWVIQ